MKLPEYSRRLEKKKRIKKFCNSSHVDRFYWVMRVQDASKSKKMTEHEKGLWYKYKGGLKND
jgi:hypothetical protein